MRKFAPDAALFVTVLLLVGFVSQVLAGALATAHFG